MTLETYKWSLDRYEELIETGILVDEPVELLDREIALMSPEGVEHFCNNDYLDEYLREVLAGALVI